MECKTKIASKVVEEPVSQKSILQVPASVTCINSNDKELQLFFTFIFFSCQKLLKAVKAKAQCWLSWGVRIAFMGFSLGQLDTLKGSELLGRSIRCTVTPSVTPIQLIEQPSLVRCRCIWTRDQHFKTKVLSFCSKSKSTPLIEARRSAADCLRRRGFEEKNLIMPWTNRRRCEKTIKVATPPPWGGCKSWQWEGWPFHHHDHEEKSLTILSSGHWLRELGICHGVSLR